MGEHRAKAACAPGHRVVEPIGFSMENYSPTGAGREVDQYGFTVDASGTWPGGPTFDGAAELALALAEDEKIAFCMTQKAFAYGLGRPATVEDLRYLDQITDNFIASDHRFAALALAIVRSDPFRYRIGEPQE